MQVPTPTPTPVPWNTPTPWPTVDATPALQISPDVGYDVAERVVAGYNFANNGGILDVFTVAFIIVLVIAGAYNIMRKLRDM